jgi:hypothetical protein
MAITPGYTYPRWQLNSAGQPTAILKPDGTTYDGPTVPVAGSFTTLVANSLNLEGNTSAFPGLRRSGAQISVRLADDSGDTFLNAKAFRSLGASNSNHTFGEGFGGGNGASLGTNGMYGFSDNTDAAAGVNDVAIKRVSAGMVEVNNGTAGTFRDLKVRQHYVDQTITAAGTTGAQTINKAAGTVNFAAAVTSIVVTNSLVTTSSTIHCTLRTNDATARIANVVPAAGSFTINLTAATTAETSAGFLVIN